VRGDAGNLAGFQGDALCRASTVTGVEPQQLLGEFHQIAA
jgi:hypothetical protein